nr:MAG TPA: hypothetical protein [Caudoviricetes sp.]
MRNFLTSLFYPLKHYIKIILERKESSYHGYMSVIY